MHLSNVRCRSCNAQVREGNERLPIWTSGRTSNRDVLVNGMNKREACRKYKLNFRTIQKILKHQEPPDYRRKAAPSVQKLRRIATALRDSVRVMTGRDGSRQAIAIRSRTFFNAVAMQAVKRAGRSAKTLKLLRKVRCAHLLARVHQTRLTNGS